MGATGDDDPACGYRQQAVLLEEISELNRTRCTKLRALHDEYYVIALMDAFIRQKQVSHWKNLFISACWMPTILQVDLASVMFNGYRREGHQFNINVYNKLLFGWVEMVSNMVYVLLEYYTTQSS